LEANVDAGEPIIVFASHAVTPLAYHYAGHNPLVPVPGAPDLEMYDMYASVLHDESEIETALSEHSPAGDSIWVVTGCEGDECSWLDVSFHPEVLETYLERNYTVESDVRFHRSRVRHMTRADSGNVD
jgi:hypothetical protein